MSALKKTVDLVVVVPVGPNTKISFANDTIESLMYYTDASLQIIIMDDSHQKLGAQIKKSFYDVDLYLTKKSLGGMAGLYVNLAYTFSYALEHYDFKILLKLDTDALVIGELPIKDVVDYFRFTEAGMAGQYPATYDGAPWDLGWPRARVLNAATSWKFIRRPIANALLRKYYVRAIKNGYRPGESVFGGSYFMGSRFLGRMRELRLLPNQLLGSVNLGEDHIFSLLVKALGFELGNLSSEGMPFACSWKGLPASPLELYTREKKIIHSTRFWKDMQEDEIREYFQKIRSVGRQNEDSPANLKTTSTFKKSL